MMRLPGLRGHSFSALVLALGCAALLQSGTAEAGRVHFSGGAHFTGRVNVRGPGVRGPSVSVHVGRGGRAWRRPWVGGSVWVGGYYYPRPYYYYYYPEYVPSYYGDGNSYYPVQPGVQPSAAPGVVAVAPARPALPTFGIGASFGSTNVKDVQESTDMSILGRLRLTPGLLLEAEFGKTSFENDSRVDRRIGGSLIWELGACNRWAPYLLGGGGVQQSDFDGSFSNRQEFGEIGVGLRWALSRNLALTVDIRAGARKIIDSNQSDVPWVARVSAPSGLVINESENYTRGRLAAILYF